MATASDLVARLEADGVVTLPPLLSPAQLGAMQAAFERRLRRLRWNDFHGYEQTERFRHMVQDVLTLDQGFVDLALHPLVKDTIRAYVGDRYALVEAKGWKSLPTRKDFHGWHGDAWYDQRRVSTIPREVKLAIYLTDVTSGAFQYVKGTQGKVAPRSYKGAEVEALDPSLFVRMTGPAGTAFLFDTSGIHRQEMPILERRHAVFLNYHDPDVPLQPEDLAYDRYHPLALNAALLGGLDDEDRRVLGFGHKTNYQPAFERAPAHEGYQRAGRAAFALKLRLDDLTSRVSARLRRLRGAKTPVEPPVTTSPAPTAVVS